MISVKEAIEITLSNTEVLGLQEVTLLKACDHILAEDINSDIDMPPFEKSSMDGYALRAADCENAPVALDVIGTIPAGSFPDFTVEAGQAAKIMTGAPLPKGADSVQMVEKTEPDGNNRVKILESVSFGKHVANRGEVMKSNAKILSKGGYITPAMVGLLATVGREKVQVFRKPAVAILITGDELVDVSETPKAGQIRNSNGFNLYHQVLFAGGVPKPLGIVSDNLQELNDRIAEGLQHDFLLITGGVSMGEFDLVEDVLADHNVEIYYDKVDIKPGKPTVFGRKGQTLVFGLPGNPVSASTVFEVIVKPAIRKILGYSQYHNVIVQAVLESDYATKTKRENYHPAKTYIKNNQYITRPLKSKGSADVLAYANSNSYLLTTQKKQNYSQGDLGEVILRDEFWKTGFGDNRKS